MSTASILCRSLLIIMLTGSTAHAVDKRLFPADTEVVVTINVRQALDFEMPDSLKDAAKHLAGTVLRRATVEQFKKAVHEQVPGYDSAMRVLDEMGFDPTRDLDTIALANPGSSRTSDLFVVLEGRFQANRFEAAAKAASKGMGRRMSVYKVGKHPVCEVKLPKAGSIWFAMASDRSFVACYREQAIKDALASVDGNKFAAHRIEKLLQTTNDKQTVSFLMTGPAITRLAKEGEVNLRKLPLPKAVAESKQVTEILETLRGAWLRYGEGRLEELGVAGAVTLQRDLNFELHVGGKDEKSAKEIEMFFKFGVAFLRIYTDRAVQTNEQLAPFVDLTRSLRVVSAGEFAVLTGSVSYLNLAKILKLARSDAP